MDTVDGVFESIADGGVLDEPVNRWFQYENSTIGQIKLVDSLL